MLGNSAVYRTHAKNRLVYEMNKIINMIFIIYYMGEKERENDRD
jgi:hypothetical protein